MKKFNSMSLGVCVAVLTVFLPVASFAEENVALKLFKESAAALKGNRPDLAVYMTSAAERIEKSLEDKKSKVKVKSEFEGKTEAEIKAIRSTRLQHLRVCAEALKSSHPDLSQGLTKWADALEKTMASSKPKSNPPAPPGPQKTVK